MIELTVNDEKEKKICEFEANMFAKYEDAITSYYPLFRAAGCELRLELGWYNPIRKKWSTNRIPIQNGYECYVYCLIEKDGEAVRKKSSDGEADWYPLETEWMITSVRRRMCKLEISLYEDLDDIDTDLKFLFSQFKSME